MVWVDGRFWRTGCPSQKLENKHHGPYHVIQAIGTHAYELDLPDTVRKHRVFRVSLLHLAADDPFATFPVTSSDPRVPYPPARLRQEPSPWSYQTPRHRDSLRATHLRLRASSPFTNLLTTTTTFCRVRCLTGTYPCGKGSVARPAP